jgi:hypothetical protein
MKTRRVMVGTVAALAIVLVAGRIIAGWYVDYQWFAALDAAEVWRVKALNMVLLRGTTFLIGTLFVFVNLYAVRRSVVSLVLPRRIGNLEFGEEVPSRYLAGVVLVLSVVIGVLLALPHGDWMSLDLIRNGDRFGETDPYFQRDLAFWLYWLPLESSLHLHALVALLAVSLVVVFLYALTPSLRWDQGRLHVSGYVRRHLFTLGAVLLLLLSWSYRLDAYRLLNAGSGPLGAFSAIDHRVGLPASLILSIVAIAAAMLVLWSGWTGQIRLAFVTITVVLLAALTLRQIVPPVVGRFVTPADPDLRERPYRATRDGYTRRAYDVDRLTRNDAPTTGLSLSDAVRGAALWDGPALSRAVARSRQAMKPNGSLGWDSDDGRLVATEAEQSTGPDAADSLPPWRLARVAADVSDDRGGPMERPDPDALDAGLLPVVLVHDSATSYYVVADSGDRVVAPELFSLRMRLAHAWHLQNPRLLRENAPAAHVRILLHRDVRNRLGMLYPFFEQGSHLAPLVWRDSLFWAVQLYATSEWYPLSETMRLGVHELHYLRHAAVALINAHSGRTVAIADPTPDPVTASWMRRFPSLFAQPSAFDPDLTRRLPPPLDGTLVAALAFARVGVRNESSPPSHVPRQTGGDTMFTVRDVSPFFDRRKGLLSVAFPLLDGADRLRGVVTSDGGAEYNPRWVPLTAPGMPWTALVDRLQHPGDSLRAIIRDARVLQGLVRVIPTAEGPLTIQTHYTTRPDGTPQALYVSVMHGDTVATGASVSGAMGLPMPTVAASPLTPEELRTRAEALYGTMREAMRRGDWNAFGAAFEALGRLLRARR